MCYLLQDTGSDTTRNVIKKELLGPPHILYHTTEHPQAEHIAQDVHEIGVQKQVGDQLIQVKIIGHEEVETSQVGKVDSPHLKDQRRQKSKSVDNQQILGNGGYTKHDTIYYFTI